jgi:Flp pilus assembly pilin Flp
MNNINRVNRTGQSTLEYLIVLVVIIAIIIAASQAIIRPAVENSLSKLGNAIEEAATQF